MEFDHAIVHWSAPTSDTFFFALLAAGALYGLASMVHLAWIAAEIHFGRPLRRSRPSLEGLKLLTIAALAIGLAGTLGEIFEAQGFAGTAPQPAEMLAAELIDGYPTRGAFAFLLLLLAHQLWRRHGNTVSLEAGALRIDARSPLGLSPV